MKFDDKTIKELADKYGGSLPYKTLFKMPQAIVDKYYDEIWRREQAEAEGNRSAADIYRKFGLNPPRFVLENIPSKVYSSWCVIAAQNNVEKRRSKTDDEKLAEIQAMNPEKRHELLLCDLRFHYRAASEGKTSWSFERDYLELKSYMALHRWSACDVAEKFGVDFKSMTKLYFKLQKSC